MDAGAFSDDKAVKAAEKLVCVLLDGDKERKLVEKYGIRGYPSILFLDPEGKPAGRLSARDAATVTKEFTELAEKHRRAPKFTTDVAKALQDARKAAKPFAIYFYDESSASTAVDQAFLNESLKATLDKFVFAKTEVKKDSPECARYTVTSAPAVLVLDPSLDKPEEKPLGRITGRKSASELKNDLERAILPPVPPGSEPAKAPPASGEGSGEPRWIFHLKNGGKLKVVSYEEEGGKYVLKLSVGTTSLSKDEVAKIAKSGPNEK